GGDNINWTNPLNWSSNPALPGAADDVSITTPGNPTIQFSTGSATIRSLNCTQTITLSGGSLTLTAGASSISGALTITGGTLKVSGAGASLFANGSSPISDSTLQADS